MAASSTSVAGPGGPTSPIGPAGPGGPATPVGPAGPPGPASPVGPAGPGEPATPVGPAGPAAPVRPCGPVPPCSPSGPTSPWHATAVSTRAISNIAVIRRRICTISSNLNCRWAHPEPSARNHPRLPSTGRRLSQTRAIVSHCSRQVATTFPHPTPWPKHPSV